VLLILVSAPVASAQGVYAKAISQARRVADQESAGGEMSFPGGVANFFNLELNTIAAGTPPVYAPSAGFVKLADALRTAGTPETADALAGKLSMLYGQTYPQVIEAVRGGVGRLNLDTSSDYRGSTTALVDALRKIVDGQAHTQLGATVQQAAETAELPAAFDAFMTASGAKLADPKAALAALEDQLITQALNTVFPLLAKQERIYRSDPQRATDKAVIAAFTRLKQ
jgi:hypothetical protein